MTISYVALGGNEGDRLANLEAGLRQMAASLSVSAISPLYETEPIGFANQEWFLNAVAAVETGMSPHELLMVLQAVERIVGKATPFPNGPRTLDLDLLLYGDQVIHDSELIVPHPRLHVRKFVLRPLADVAPNATHPTLGKKILHLLNNVGEDGVVQAWDGVSQIFPAHQED